MRALGVHGIAVDEPYGEAWAECIGIDVIEGRWPSCGRWWGDVARLIGSGAARFDAVAAVSHSLKLFADAGGDVIVAHSMGQPLAFAAERCVKSGLPIVTCGGPLSHPVWGRSLALVGLSEPPPPPAPRHFWNADDGVCASPILGARHPPWTVPIRVALPGRDGYVGEHDATDYLAHPVVSAMIRQLAGMRSFLT